MLVLSLIILVAIVDFIVAVLCFLRSSWWYTRSQGCWIDGRYNRSSSIAIGKSIDRCDEIVIVIAKRAFLVPFDLEGSQKAVSD